MYTEFLLLSLGIKALIFGTVVSCGTTQWWFYVLNSGQAMEEGGRQFFMH